jgi:thymidylate synthase
MLQEVVARTLGLGLGHYHHSVGSLHLYTDDLPKAEQFLSEGLQDDLPMPPMPQGDPKEGLSALENAEKDIRTTKKMPVMPSTMPAYWRDLVRLLAIFASSSSREIVKLKNEMSSKTFENFIRKRHQQRIRNADLPLFDRTMEKRDARSSS